MLAGKTNHPVGTKVKINRIVAEDLGFLASFDIKFKSHITGILTHPFPGVGTDSDKAIAGLILDHGFKGLVVGGKLNVFEGDFELVNKKV